MEKKTKKFTELLNLTTDPIIEKIIEKGVEDIYKNMSISIKTKSNLIFNIQNLLYSKVMNSAN
jgi:transcriptional/translational regulatory protein YebC/TACO1